MKMTSWIALSAVGVGLPEAVFRMRLYRGQIPMPRRHVVNRRVMEVLDSPLSSDSTGDFATAKWSFKSRKSSEISSPTAASNRAVSEAF